MAKQLASQFYRLSVALPKAANSFWSRLIRHSGRFGRLNYVVDFLMLVFSQFALAGLGFMTRRELANTLGRRQFGELAAAMALGSIVAVVAQFGMEKSLIGEYIRLPNQRGDVLHASLKIKVPLYLISLSSVLVLWLSNDPSHDRWACITVIIAVSTQAFSLQPLYDACNWVRGHMALFLAERSLYFMPLWAILAYHSAGLRLASVGNLLFCSALAGLTLQYLYARKEFMRHAGPKEVSAISLIKGNRWVWLGGLGGLLVDGFTPVILAITSGPIEGGKFSAAFIIIQAGCLVISQIVRVGNAAIARKINSSLEKQGGKRLLVRYLILVFVLGGGIAATIGLLSPWLIGFFSLEYREAEPLLRILSLVPCFFGLYSSLITFLILRREQHLYFVCVSSCGLVSMLSMTFLTRAYGAVGAAWSLLGNSALLSLVLACAALILCCRKRTA